MTDEEFQFYLEEQVGDSFDFDPTFGPVETLDNNEFVLILELLDDHQRTLTEIEATGGNEQLYTRLTVLEEEIYNYQYRLNVEHLTYEEFRFYIEKTISEQSGSSTDNGNGSDNGNGNDADFNPLPAFVPDVSAELKEKLTEKQLNALLNTFEIIQAF